MPKLESRLLIVTDRRQTRGRPLLSVLDRAFKGGVPAVQLRERDLTAKELVSLAREVGSLVEAYGAQLVINDRIDVALALEGVGVHLRSDGMPATVARRLLGPHRLLGISTHSVEDVVRAEASGVDYAILGPLYETPTKREFGLPLGLKVLEEACRRTRIPIVGIGGITATRARDVRQAGAFGVAVIAAVLSAEDVEASTRELFDVLRTSS